MQKDAFLSVWLSQKDYFEGLGHDGQRPAPLGRAYT